MKYPNPCLRVESSNGDGYRQTVTTDLITGDTWYSVTANLPGEPEMYESYSVHPWYHYYIPLGHRVPRMADAVRMYHPTI